MRIGLVLSGGVAKGAYQAGFLKAFNEEFGDNNEIVAISCASIGMFSGYALSAGKVDQLIELWEDIHFDSTPDLLLNVWARNFLKITIHKLLEPGDELKIPVVSPCALLPLAHVSWGKMQGEFQNCWYNFFHGSIAFPFLTGAPRLYRYQFAIDGGAVDNIPVLPFVLDKSLDCDLIMIVHFEASYTVRNRYSARGIPIIEYDISQGSFLRRHSFHFQNSLIKTYIQDGYRYGKRICSELFNKGQHDLPTLLAVARRHHNEEFGMRMNSRGTFETFVQRLNEFLYPLISFNFIKIRELKDKKPRKERRAEKRALRKAKRAEKKRLQEEKTALQKAREYAEELSPAEETQYGIVMDSVGEDISEKEFSKVAEYYGDNGNESEAEKSNPEQKKDKIKEKF